MTEQMSALRVKVRVPDGMKRAGASKREAIKALRPWGEYSGPEYITLAPFGGPFEGRDSDGEAFSEGRTDMVLRVGDERPVTYYHGFGPDDPHDWQEIPAIIGVARYDGVGEVKGYRGHVFRVRLDDTEPLAKRIIAAPPDKLASSTGAAGHMVRSDRTGIIEMWPVGELAVFDTNEWRQPANPWAVVVPAKAEQAKAVAEAAEPAKATAEQREVEAETKSETKPDEGVLPTEGKTVDEKEIKAQEAEQEQPETPALDVEALVAQVKAAAAEAATEAVKALAAEPPINAGAVKAEVGKRVAVHVKNDRVLRLSDALLKARKSGAPVYVAVTDGAFKALAEGTDTAGGYLVAPEYSNQMIEMLRARAVVRRAGATVWRMRSDTLNIPSQTGGATAYWSAENASITPSDQAFGRVQLVAKKLTALTQIPNELIEDSDPSAEAAVMRDLVNALRLAEDLAYLRGDGASDNPVGVRNISGVTVTALDDGSGNGKTPDFDDLLTAMYTLDAADAPPENRAWIVHPRTVKTLRGIKDTTGKYVWSDPAAPGDPPTVWGYPVFVTTQIPINLTVGTSTNASEIYFGAWSEAIIGERKVIELRASDQAGNAFQYDQTWVRAIMRVGFNLRHAAAFTVLTGVLP